MNMLSGIILVIFIVFAIIGYKRGLIKSVFKIVLTAVALLLAYILAPIISNFIIEHTNIDNSIRNKIHTSIADEVFSQELTKNEQVDFIQNMKVPEFIRTALIESNHSEMRDEMGVSNFFDYVATYLSHMIVNAIAFFVVFIFLNLILSLTLILLSFVMKLPGLNGLNRLGGLALALVEALVLVWLFFIIVDVTMTTEFGVDMYSQITESKMLNFLYDNNIIAGFIRKSISFF